MVANTAVVHGRTVVQYTATRHKPVFGRETQTHHLEASDYHTHIDYAQNSFCNTTT